MVIAEEFPGEPMMPDDPLPTHLPKLSEQRDCHFKGNIGVHAAFTAKSYRTPAPRFRAEQRPFGSSFLVSICVQDGQLERAVK